MYRVIYDNQTFALQQYGGISRYFCEVATRVARSDIFDVRVIAPVYYNDYLKRSSLRTIGAYVPQRIQRTGRLYRAANSLIAPLLTWLARPALVHQTYYQATRTPKSVKRILTVFDMIHELFPDNFPASDTTASQKRESVEAADHILCISKNTKKDLVRLLDVDPEKVSVTYLGCSGLFGWRPSLVEDSGAFGRPYILFVGHRAGYKNFANALKAYAESTVLHREFDLLAFGGLPFNADELNLFRSLGLRENSVRRLVGDDVALAHAYRHARVLIYPSLYEGFGIPPLEAMSCGCPVAGSNTSSIPEVIGPAGELFDPTSTESIAKALERVCLDENHRCRLTEAGADQLRLFSWDRCAMETLSAYRTTLGLHA